MTRFMSDQNRTCFQYESGTYANTSGTRQWLGLVQDHSLEPNMNVMQIRYQGSTDRNVDDFADGMKEWNGTITYYPQDWKMLGFAIGSIQDVSGTTSTHVFSETNSDDRVQTTNTPLTSLTIEDSKNIGTAGSNFIRTTVGAMVDSFELKAAVGEIVSCDVGYIAQDSTMSSGAVTSLAPTTTKPYVFNNIKLEIPDGTLVGNAKEVTFSVNNNIDRDNVLNGSRVANGLLPMNREYEVSTTLNMDDSNARTFYESYYVAGSEFNAELSALGVAGSLYLIMSGCKMTDMGVPSPLEGIQEQSFTFVPSHVCGSAFDSTVLYNLW
jgi:hypothetical protein